MSNDQFLSDAENYRPRKMNYSAFRKYVARYGIERARGYLDAIQHLANNMEGLFYEQDNGEFYLNNSPQKIRTRLVNFINETTSLVEQINSSKLIDKNRDHIPD